MPTPKTRSSRSTPPALAGSDLPNSPGVPTSLPPQDENLPTAPPAPGGPMPDLPGFVPSPGADDVSQAWRNIAAMPLSSPESNRFAAFAPTAVNVQNPVDPGAKVPPPMPPVQVAGPQDAAVKGIVRLAMQYVGTPYVWGGESPSGFDCSGLLQYLYAKKGISIPRVTYDQFKAGVAVSKGQLKPGDAVFFRGADPKGGLPGHVGIYIGGGRFIEAPGRGKVVRISYLKGRSDYVGARRYGKAKKKK